MEAVPRLPMLSFELKVSPESTSFGPKLKQYIRDVYHEDPEMYNNEIHQLEGLRATAVCPVRDVTGCTALKRYFCQLQFLQSRFPMSKDGAAAVSFTWRDSYASLVCTLTDIRFEMVSILHNIGALHTQLGAADSRVTADGMKLSCTHFQCAAWAFQHLKDTYPQPAGVDLAPDVMQFMYHLSLAQAQECILEKSMMDNRKATIIAKVAVQIVDYYNLALNTLEQGGSDDCSFAETVGSKVYKNWKRYVKFKIAYHSCVSLLYQGQQAEEQQKMGERVSYYVAASEKLEEATKLCKGMDHIEAINEALAFTNDVVEGKKKAAKNENEFIYHEEVPDKDALPDIKGASLVKGIPFNINDPEVSGPDIFARLVPMKAHEASSLYSEEKAKLLRRIGGMIDEKDQELVTFMTSLQLDHLNIHSESERLPQELVDRCAALSAKPNAIQNLVEAMNKLADTYHDVEGMLQDIKELIQLEETREKEYQVIMGKRPPSIVATDLTREANKYQEAHAKASESNQTLHKAMTLHISNLKVLSLSLDELQKQIPSIHSLEGSIDEAAVKDMQHLNAKVEEMRRQRAMLATQLRESTCQDDITRQLVTRTGEPLDTIFNQEMQKHQRYVSLIEQNLAAQDNILKALTEAYARYADTRKATNEVIRKREATINALISSYDAYEDLLAKSSKGLEFYRKLETNVGKLLQRVKGTCKVQEEEREQILAKNNKISSYSAVNKSVSDIPVSTYSAPKLKDYLAGMKQSGTTGVIGYPSAAVSPLPGSYYNTNMVKYGQVSAPVSSAQPSNYYDPQVPSVRPAPVGSEGTNDQTSSVKIDQGENRLAKPQDYSYMSAEQTAAAMKLAGYPSSTSSYPSGQYSYVNSTSSYIPSQSPALGQQQSQYAYPQDPSRYYNAYMQQYSTTGHSMPSGYAAGNISANQNMTGYATGNPASTNMPAGYTAGTATSGQNMPTGYAAGTAPSGQNMPTGYAAGTAPSGQNMPGYTAGTVSAGQNLPTGYNAGTASAGQNMSSGHVVGSASAGQNMTSGCSAGTASSDQNLPSGYTAGTVSASQNMPSGYTVGAVSSGQNIATGYMSGTVSTQPGYGTVNATASNQSIYASATYPLSQNMQAGYGSMNTVVSSQNIPTGYPAGSLASTQNITSGHTSENVVSSSTMPSTDTKSYANQPAVSHTSYHPYQSLQQAYQSAGVTSYTPTSSALAHGYNTPLQHNMSSTSTARTPTPHVYTPTAANIQASYVYDTATGSYQYLNNYYPTQSQQTGWPQDGRNVYGVSTAATTTTTTASTSTAATAVSSATSLSTTTATPHVSAAYFAGVQQQQYQQYQYPYVYSTETGQVVGIQSGANATTQYQYMPGPGVSSYTNAGRHETSQVSSSSQTSLGGGTYAAQYEGQSYNAPTSQTSYYSLPYGYQHTSDSQNTIAYQTPNNVAQQQTMSGYTTVNQTYMQARDSTSSTTTTNSQDGGNSRSSISSENTSGSNVDLLAGLDFSLNQAPLVPQQPVSTGLKTEQESTKTTSSPAKQVSSNSVNIPPSPTSPSPGSPPVTKKVEPPSDETNSTTASPKKEVSNEKDVNQLNLSTKQQGVPETNQEDGKLTPKSFGKDPYTDAESLNQFVQEVGKYEKFVEGLTTKTLNGPTPLDMKWKELLELQEKDAHKRSISVARCYPMKNRFPDILPYDHSRIELPSTKDDYINASYMKNLTPLTPPFIVTQAPLPSTYTDFWTMVWEQQVEVIVCLLSDSELEGQVYWPVEKGQELAMGKMKLALQSSNVRSHWIERIVSVSVVESRATRVIVHLQFTAWPGSSFPASPGPFLSFVTETLNFYSQQRGANHPVVVHCLSGVGRTGLFCLVAAAICEIQAGRGLLDLVTTTASMSTHRKNSLRDREHLKFAYQAVLYYAQDLLMKRGILTSRSTFEDKRSRGGKSHTRHPSEDFLLGPPTDLSQLQSGIEKMGLGATNNSSSSSEVKLDGSISSTSSSRRSSTASDISHKKYTPENFIAKSKTNNLKPQDKTDDPLSQIDALWPLKRQRE